MAILDDFDLTRKQVMFNKKKLFKYCIRVRFKLNI